jgi:hypothetical protein
MKPLYTKKELLKLLKEKQKELATINLHTLVCNINLDMFDLDWQIAMHVEFPNSSPTKEELGHHIDRMFETHLTIEELGHHIDRIYETHLTIECLEHDFEICSEQLKTIKMLLQEYRS